LSTRAVDDVLYVRAYNGQNSRWYEAAMRQKAGRPLARDGSNASSSLIATTTSLPWLTSSDQQREELRTGLRTRKKQRQPKPDVETVCAQARAPELSLEADLEQVVQGRSRTNDA
jgi:hypothetical protein